MAEDRVPLLGLLQAVPQGGAQPPLASMPSFDPLTGAPMAPIPGIDKVLRGLAQGAIDTVKTPSAVMQPNPYPAGSEEHQWFENQRQDTMNNWAPGMALGMIGAGAPMAEEGALGMAGGRMTFVDKAAARVELNRSSRLIDKFWEKNRAAADGGPRLTGDERSQWKDAFRTKQDAQDYLTSSQLTGPVDH